ncbi:MAG: Uncharacterised protein [Flavobacteriaceae bacterium]|nr:MAG: Uncharacterised protein [Flavobacteriaceae bacterium]
MASKRADCTFAGARLISSAKTKLAKMGPFLMLKSFSFILYIRVPTTSAGNRSGVNCTLLKLPFTALDSVLMASVFAKPGTPSNKMWPWPRSPISNRSIMCFWPTITLFISMVRISTKALSFSILSFNAPISVGDAVCSIILFSVLRFIILPQWVLNSIGVVV